MENPLNPYFIPINDILSKKSSKTFKTKFEIKVEFDSFWSYYDVREYSPKILLVSILIQLDSNSVFWNKLKINELFEIHRIIQYQSYSENILMALSIYNEVPDLKSIYFKLRVLLDTNSDSFEKSICKKSKDELMTIYIQSIKSYALYFNNDKPVYYPKLLGTSGGVFTTKSEFILNRVEPFYNIISSVPESNENNIHPNPSAPESNENNIIPSAPPLEENNYVNPLPLDPLNNQSEFLAKELFIKEKLLEHNLTFVPLKSVDKIYDLLANNVVFEDHLLNDVELMYYGLYYAKFLKNYDLSIKFYKLAIVHSNSMAMNNLGFLYSNTFKNYPLAKKYYMMAIEKGEVLSMYNLGNIYFNEKNFYLAKKLLLLAEQKGHVLATQMLKDFDDIIEKKYDKSIKKAYLNDSYLAELFAVDNSINQFNIHSQSQVLESLSCVICMNSQKTVVFLPCKHLCSCHKCSIDLENCPLCRAKIVNCMEVYL